MDKTKVLHIITRLDQGGSPENTLITASHLQDSGFDITLAYGVTQEFPSRLMDEAGNKGVKFIYIKDLVRNISPFRDMRALLSLISLIKKGKFDIIHTHASKAGILGRLAAKTAFRSGCRPALIHTPHGHIFYGYYNFFISGIFLQMEKWAAKFTDKIVALTESGVNEHLQFGVGKNKSDFVVIPSGVDIGSVCAQAGDLSEKRRELDLPEDIFLIGSAGRLEKVKGFGYLAESAAEILRSFPECRFLLVGDGSRRAQIERIIADLGIKDKFRLLGWREDADQIISVMDIFVVPSLNEGMGRVIVKAMALGKPIVASKVGGIPSLVSDGENGLLVPPKDPRLLAMAVVSLLKDPATMKRMGEKGRAKAAFFSSRVMIEKTIDLYRGILKK